MKSEKSQELFKLMLQRGYDSGFAQAICMNLSTDWTAQRMIGYLLHYDDLPMEEVADEMLAILSDRERIIDKKMTEEANAKWNAMMWNGFPFAEDEE